MTNQDVSTYMENPEISIIVPVYHVEKYLRRALDSLLRQTYSNFELILINDGGNDEEAAICEEYAQKDKRIIYIAQDNQSLSAVRNRALEIHRGKWIMFADSDDWVREDFCEKALDTVRTTNADMCIFDLVYTKGDDTDGYPHRVGLPAGVYDSDRILAARVCGKVQCYVWNKIFREELWKGISFPVGESYGDDAVIHEVIDKAKKIAVIHDILYYKPFRPDSITSVAAKEKRDTYWLYRQRRRRWEYLKQHHPEMLPLSEKDMVNVIIAYARDCLFFTGDSEGYEDARCWAKKAKIPLNKVKLQKQIRYFTFLHSKTLFRLQEGMIIALKKLLKVFNRQ